MPPSAEPPMRYLLMSCRRADYAAERREPPPPPRCRRAITLTPTLPPYAAERHTPMTTYERRDDTRHADVYEITPASAQRHTRHTMTRHATPPRC